MVWGYMSITVQLNLPDAVAAKAKARGLLDPKRLAKLIATEIERTAAEDDFFAIVRRLRSLPGDAMSMEEIQTEVDGVRAEQRQRRESGA